MKLAVFVLLAAVPALAQERRDPRVTAIVQRIDAARMQATVEKLVSFGTRHTLSDVQDPKRGIGAARKWLAEQFAQAAQGSKMKPFEDRFMAVRGLLSGGADVASIDGGIDAILLDLYEGPHAASQRGDDRFYGRGALDRCYRALAPGGVLAVWSEDPDEAFLRRMRGTGFTVNVDRSGTTRVHIVYLGAKRR